ncbi:hypothetical protein Tco_1538841 [Tanacetum coccineum]
MSNTNNNMKTQTSSALHNAIIKDGGKDHPPMLAPGNYVQWKSQIKRYIDTKINHELIHFFLKNLPYQYKFRVPDADATPATPSNDGTPQQPREEIILRGIDKDIYSIVDACPNVMEMWKAIERFYKMMNELVRNQCIRTNHQVNVKFLLQLKPEWQMFMIIVKQYQNDILKQHQNEVNEIRVERLARTANPLALLAQQQPVKQQVAPRYDKWVPFSEIVKISSTNIRLETTVPQKEETFQQFWYSIKKLQGTDSYEFLLANKKCTINAEVFRTILDICQRVEGVDFTDVSDDDT